MKYFFKFTFFLLVLSFSFYAFMFTSCAKENVYEKLQNNFGAIMSVSHRGDSVNYPENSLEAVLSAFEKGADMVSVSVRLSSDGVFVLAQDGDFSASCKTDVKDAKTLDFASLSNVSYYETDGSVSKCTVSSLEKLLDTLSKENILIIDNAWEYKDEMYSFVKEHNAFDRIILRTDEKASAIKEWKNDEKAEISVIGVCSSAIVFKSVSHINTLFDEACVQFQSKNYFNEMYKSFVTKRFSYENAPRALAPMYDEDLCGQRTDSETGWDEMINRGFTVIETNCIEELTAYIEHTEKVKSDLQSLLQKAEKVDTNLYSSGSEKNFSYALKEAKEVFENNNSSLEKLQKSYSNLSQAMKNLTFGTHEDEQRGNLNITPLKLFFAVFFGLIILTAEVYVYKKQKEKFKK